MMSSEKKRLQKILKSAYFGKEATEVSDFWQQRTMIHIREMAGLASNQPSSQMDLAVRLIWRFAGAAALVAMVFSLYAVQIDWNPEMEMARLFLHDPIEFGILETTGVL